MPTQSQLADDQLKSRLDDFYVKPEAGSKGSQQEIINIAKRQNKKVDDNKSSNNGTKNSLIHISLSSFFLTTEAKKIKIEKASRILLISALIIALLMLSGCYSSSRLIRSEVVLDGMVGTTMDVDAFNQPTIGVDFGLVRVTDGDENGSSKFWSTTMLEHYEKESKIAQCIASNKMFIKQVDDDLYSVKAHFYTPSHLSNSKQHKAQAENWLEKCDCPENVGATCFEDYVIREIERKLTNHLGGSENGLKNPNIKPVYIRQMRRRLGTLVQSRRRILTDELGVYQRLSEPGKVPYNIERLDTGKKICFQSYSLNNPEILYGGGRSSALVPGALSCMKWIGLVQPFNSHADSKDFLVGLDPITPLGFGWSERERAYFKPINKNNIGSGYDYWAPLDRVIDADNRNFPSALLFTSNYKQTALISDNEDLEFPNSHPGMGLKRGSILLLFRNAALREFIQQQYAYDSTGPDDLDRDGLECIADGTTHDSFNECVKTLVKRWLKLEKGPARAGQTDPKDYYYDLVLPSNIRPFTQIPIYLNNEVRWVRTGSSLLTILDEKFRLTQEVMESRISDTRKLPSVIDPPHSEVEVIKRAIKNITLKSRRAGQLVEIHLDEVKSLKALAIPLTPGDELTW